VRRRGQRKWAIHRGIRLELGFGCFGPRGLGSLVASDICFSSGLDSSRSLVSGQQPDILNLRRVVLCLFMGFSCPSSGAKFSFGFCSPSTGSLLSRSRGDKGVFLPLLSIISSVISLVGTVSASHSTAHILHRRDIYLMSVPRAWPRGS